jgi:molybdenum cofactor biosynthesis protein B
MPIAPSNVEHEREAATIVARVAILTLSDTRKPDDDRSGRAIRAHLESAGHRVVDQQIIKDDADALAEWLERWQRRDDVDAIISTGGTGLSSRDVTVPVVRRWIATELPGFGEIFRMLSFEQVGPAAMMSRALAGSRGRQAIFALPGSTNAVDLAMTRLIVPQLKHVLRELRK